MGQSDAELIERWLQGDSTAFEDLVRRWQQPVANFLYRLTGRSAAVPDLCQEVFLRVYRAGPRYREMQAFSTWLYRIALNVFRDSRRRQRHEAVPLEGDVPEQRPASADACQQQEVGRLVAQTVAELPEPLRLALVLHHYEGMNFEQMARLTGTAASTLKSRFGAALQRLKTRFQQLGLGPE